MTNDELQAHIDAILKARDDGLLEESGGGAWLAMSSKNPNCLHSWIQLGGAFRYRIKQREPREIFIATEDIPGAGCGHPNAYVLDASELAALANPAKFRKFREVLE